MSKKSKDLEVHEACQTCLSWANKFMVGLFVFCILSLIYKEITKPNEQAPASPGYEKSEYQKKKEREREGWEVVREYFRNR